MRVFVAILLPQEVKEKIRDVARLFYKEKRNLKFVTPEQLHMTIKFLGNNVTQESIEKIMEQLKIHQGELNKATIDLEKISFGFKGETRPTVLSYLVKRNPELDNLVQNVHALIRELELDDIAPRKDRSTLINHITIARAKPIVNRNFKNSVNKILENADKKTHSFTADSISLLQSDLVKLAPTYKEIAKIALR